MTIRGVNTYYPIDDLKLRTILLPNTYLIINLIVDLYMSLFPPAIESILILRGANCNTCNDSVALLDLASVLSFRGANQKHYTTRLPTAITDMIL